MMGSNSKPPTWLLLDGNNGVVTDAFATGVDRAAAQYVNRVVDLIDHFKASTTIACWDSPTCFRRELLDTYKAGRKRLPGVDGAIAEAKELLQRAGIWSVNVDGFEADDLIATYTKIGRADGARVVIYSRDRDLHQLISEGEVCQLLQAKRRSNSATHGAFEFVWRNEEGLRVNFEVTPSQWVDFKCLTGDPSDSIRGVDGIGEQIAGRLLKACGSLDKFYSNPFQYALTDKKRAALLNAKNRIPLLRQLCTLRSDVPLPDYWREAC